MKILVIGSGGREHALAWKLAQSPEAERIFCAPGNGGTEEIAENIAIASNDLPALARFAKENRIDLAVVGPDDTLAAGIVDLFEAEGLRIFGPSKSAAQLEWSKIFAKELMEAEGIPTARARAFSLADDALAYCAEAEMPVVVKADGLALGKGVVIAQDRVGAAEAVRAMMTGDAFGAAGRSIVIEKFLVGSECSVHALVSGGQFRMLATARDHKRAFDGDDGPNTGGMGAVSPADNWNGAREEEFGRAIVEPLLAGLTRRGIEFRGLLFPGLMITSRNNLVSEAEGSRGGSLAATPRDPPASLGMREMRATDPRVTELRVLEFNCRFGDPETQAILPRLQSDLLPALLASINGDLDTPPLRFDTRPAVTVILASGGYPGKYETGKPISGLDPAARMPDIHIFHGGTTRRNGEVVTAGGRVLAVTALGDSVTRARERAYAAVAEIHFEGCHFRRDIALPPQT